MCVAERYITDQRENQVVVHRSDGDAENQGEFRLCR